MPLAGKENLQPTLFMSFHRLDRMAETYFHSKPTGLMGEARYDCRRILYGGKNTIVILCDKFHTMRLKPPVSILVAEFAQQTLHQPGTAGIDV